MRVQNRSVALYRSNPFFSISDFTYFDKHFTAAKRSVNGIISYGGLMLIVSKLEYLLCPVNKGATHIACKKILPAIT